MMAHARGPAAPLPAATAAGLQMAAPGNAPAANYNVLSENLRRVTPNGIQCSFFCGGRRCKYETPDAWDAAHMAIDGVFSHWVTDNILAMARPSTDIIRRKNIIHQFQSAGIRSIINLQLPGEHASCGNALEASGFTYDPDAFMQNSIYFYNFGWRDYGEATTTGLLDMVKVMAFALEEGKVAVHCHAGLGRTGVLIACYLVYSLRVRANDAIRFVRLKRPNAVQTRGQILCVQEFEQFILPHSIVFCNKDSGKDKKQQDFTLTQYLHRQAFMLHGYEARLFKYIPKIIFILCERILQLCQCCTYSYISDGSNMFTRSFVVARLNMNSSCLGLMRSSLSASSDSTVSSNVVSAASTRRPSTDLSSNLTDEEQSASATVCISPDMPSCASGMSGLDDNCLDAMLGDGIEGQSLDENMCYQELSSQGELEKASEKERIIPYNVEDAIQALLADHHMLGEGTRKYIKQLRTDLNHRQSAWARLRIERNMDVLTSLLFEWLEQLKSPILDRDDLSYIVILGNRPENCLKKLDLATQYTLEYLLRFLARLQPISIEATEDLIKRLICSLTHQGVAIKGILKPAGKGYHKLREGTYRRVMEFMIKVFDMVYDNTNSSRLSLSPDSSDRIEELRQEHNT